MALDKDAILDAVSALTIVELNDLVKAFEEKFGVSAAALAGTSAITGVSIDEVEEQTEFTVVLKNIGVNKISVIKAIREITGLGLKEAKDLVDSAPKLVKEGVSKSTAEAVTKKLVDAGAEAEIK